jgi:N-glycosylase/DNA lyase
LNDLTVKLSYHFSLSNTLECGQCFRWEVYQDVKVNGTDSFCGIVEDDFVLITQRDENTLVFHDTELPSFNKLWKAYFDLERDYEPLKKIFSRDAFLSKAIEFCGGIRVLRQPRWETLCSYIISQNNNIPRIKSLIKKICTSFGNSIKTKRPDGLVQEDYSFPRPEVLSKLEASDLEKLGFGYRAPYIVFAAQKVASGELNLDSVAEMPIDKARAELRKLFGVGPKVAECSLLYGFGREEAFPVDTWIKTVMSEFYPSGLPEFVKPYAGIAQIFLFHYIRNRGKIS